MRSRILRLHQICNQRLINSSSLRNTCAGARWNSSTTNSKSNSSTSSGRQWSTPLAKILGEAITTTGPIPVATYMRQCLTSDLGGYYTAETPDKDQFGRKGDFVTSPEISQVFGELVGLWVVAEWIAQGRKSSGVYLMEVGPGRGTLMDDMLRTIRNFKDMVTAIDGIYLIEASPSLRAAQHKLLCGENPLDQTDVGYGSRSKYDEKLRVVWCEDVRLLPKESDWTPFIVAHEFFDALPIHVFQSVPPNPDQPDTIQTPTGPIDAKKLPRAALEHQWRELVVSPTSPFTIPSSPPVSSSPEDVPDFELTLSRASTPHSLYLPEQSARYKALKSTPDTIIEISPESQSYAADFAVRIGGGALPTSPTTKPTRGTPPAKEVLKKSPSGAALIIDYGPASAIPRNSLRGIQAHKHVSPFVRAGQVDLSADVDFLALAEAALNASQGVEVHGPVSQGAFLGAMGIEARVAQLVKRALERERGKGLGEAVKRIEGGWRRLVDRGEGGMGGLYQVMAVVPYRGEEGLRRPVGFGGDVKL
ncbi:DUF185-domain-containing protein, partial [Myriangium duriaei CBS 260.36]